MQSGARRRGAVVAAVILAAQLAAMSVAAKPSAPRVVVSIAPVHSLVAQVMKGVGVPELMLSAKSSPHALALRPQQARMLAKAELIVWIGPAFEPGPARAVAALGEGAQHLTLARVAGVRVLGARPGGAHRHEAGDASAKKAHAKPPVGALDPHIWLDPVNAKLWLDAIALRLAEIDPAHAPRYIANAAAARAEMDLLIAELRTQLTPVRERRFVTLHDSTQYFEHRFGTHSVGSVGARASAGRVMKLAQELKRAGADCLFVEGRRPAPVATMLAREASLRIATLDPAGAKLTPGPGFYSALLRGVARSMVGCLTAAGK
ncbi:MAG: zinc ABC transporter substrate-binding protein [Neomegalonema sp.]|nr:zinc ABC transporter substrate-binding protein [Neomegalonema sp.]